MTNMFKPSVPQPSVVMQQAATAAPAPTPTMPDPSAPTIVEASRRAQMRIANRAGSRRDTILNPGGSSGAPGSDRFSSYTASRLGSDN